MTKAVLFDMDGVIFDSERAVFEGWMELSRKYGFKDLEKPYMQCIGVNAARCREIFLDFYGQDFPYEEMSAEEASNYAEKYSGGRLPQKPGVAELLSYLKENGFFVAVASSTRTEKVENQIREAGLLPYFDRIVGGDMVSRSKPNPDIFLKAGEGLNPETDTIYVIEDSHNGVRAAKAAGYIPIMVPDMLPANEEMREIAAYICNDLLEVRDLLKELEK